MQPGSSAKFASHKAQGISYRSIFLAGFLQPAIGEGFGQFALARSKKQVAFKAMLLVIELAIASAERVEFLMSAPLDDLPLLHD